MKSISVKKCVSGIFMCAAVLLSCNKKDPDSTVQVEQVTATPSTVEIEVGASASITVAVLPAGANQAVSWDVVDGQIAEVANGVITGKSAGNTTVTVTSVEDASKSATISVKVTDTEEVIPVEGISFADSQIEIDEGDDFTATVIFDPANATNKGVSWSSSDETVATVDDGVITGLKDGSAVITAVSDDNPEASAVLNVTVKAVGPIDLTHLLENTSAPFAKGDVVKNRFYEILGWKTNPAGAANGNVDTYVVFNDGLCFPGWINSIPGEGIVEITNGKLYQTIVDLEAGTYSFDVTAFFNLETQTYIVIASGNDLPDINDFDDVLGRNYIPAPISEDSPVDISTEFVLSEKSTVSLGFVSSIGDGEVVISKVELWKK